MDSDKKNSSEGSMICFKLEIMYMYINKSSKNKLRTGPARDVKLRFHDKKFWRQKFKSRGKF